MGTSLLVSCLKGTKNSANDKCLLAESCRGLCIEIQTDTAGTTLFPSGSVFSKNCTSGENKCLLYRCSPKKTVPLQSVNYVTMNYGDRIPRTRQAFLVSSACVAAPERMATRPLCAFIYRVTGQDAGTPEIMENPHMLNSTNDSEILQRGGVRAGIKFSKGCRRKFFFRQPSITQEPHKTGRISATRQHAGGDFHISPDACGKSKPCRKHPGLFVGQ